MRINIFYDYSYLLQGENYIESRPTNKIFLQSVQNKPKPTENKKSGILDMSIPDTPEKVNNKSFPSFIFAGLQFKKHTKN